MAATTTDVALPGAQAEPAEGAVAETPTQAIAVSTDLSAVELKRIRRLLLMTFLMALLTAAYFARDVLLPMVLAVVLTLTLLPAIRWGERLRVPPFVTSILLMVVLGLSIFAAGYFLSGPVGDLVADAPAIAEAVREELGGVIDGFASIQEMSEQVTDATASAGAAGAAGGEAQNEVVVVDGDRQGIVASAVSGLASAGGAVAGALLLTLFLLGGGDFYHRRIVESQPRLRDKKKALTIIRDVERQISRYLGSITVINLGLGAATASVLGLLGMPTPVVWGVLAFLLNYVPFVGNLITVALVGAVSLTAFPDLWSAALPPLAVLALAGLESNVVTPLIVGRRLELNAVSQLVMVAFWTWLWGVPGAILAVPFLVVVKAVCDNVEALQVLGSFLSGDPADRVDEAPQKATTGPALASAPLRTQAEARDDSPPTQAPGEARITPLPAQ